MIGRKQREGPEKTGKWAEKQAQDVYNIVLYFKVNLLWNPSSRAINTNKVVFTFHKILVATLVPAVVNVSVSRSGRAEQGHFTVAITET